MILPLRSSTRSSQLPPDDGRALAQGLELAERLMPAPDCGMKYLTRAADGASLRGCDRPPSPVFPRPGWKGRARPASPSWRRARGAPRGRAWAGPPRWRSGPGSCRRVLPGRDRPSVCGRGRRSRSRSTGAPPSGRRRPGKPGQWPGPHTAGPPPDRPGARARRAGSRRRRPPAAPALRRSPLRRRPGSASLRRRRTGRRIAGPG